MDMPRSEAQKRADKKYSEKKYYQIGIRFQRDEFDELKERIAKTGESFNSFVVNAVYERLAKKELTEK